MMMNMYNLCVFVLSLCVIVGSVNAAVERCIAPLAPYDCPTCVLARVGRAEYVYGPGPAPMDNPFFSVIDDINGDTYGYSANGNTLVIVNGQLAQTETNPTIALLGGVSTMFDECGSWLNSAFSDGNKVRGWYHAEGMCNYEIGQTSKSIAYCESSDGGQSFQKLSYPNNQVLTGVLPPTPDRTVGNGDHSVVEGDDGYYYIFYINWDNYGLCVARSPMVSGGVPGTWWKYYQGAWSQPGLGGNSSSVPNMVGATVYKHKSGNLLSVGNGAGVSLAFGNDAVTWRQMDAPLVFAENSQWTRTATSTELIAYPAFVPLVGGSEAIGPTFWLYYTYLEPGAGFDKRYLIRRKVQMAVASTPNYGARSAVELSRYRTSVTGGAATWATTSIPLKGNYTYELSLGYMLTAASSGTIPLYDCYIPGWNDYMVMTESCLSSPGINYVRLMGWLYTTPQPSTSPIYRCWNPTITKHSVSKNLDCDGNGTYEFILGYILDM